MKTTVELPDELLMAVKKRAAETRTTMKSILERGLRRELGAPLRRRSPSGRPKVRWVTVAGPLARGLDPADREKMHEYLRRHDRD